RPTQLPHQHIEEAEAEAVGDPPVQRDRTLEINGELLPRGLVEPEELAIVLGEALIFWVAWSEAQRRISRHQAEERVVQTDNPEDRDRGVNALSDHDLQDSRQFASLPSLPRRSIVPSRWRGRRRRPGRRSAGHPIFRLVL